ncbi:MAG: DUF4153 domain-containing protein [marine benthic group bacterium]|nr:DUF4153 domain-containing protein [Gemmatimonadota bacterium]MCL7957356.1 DUF4153 domain-containing protein [Gemmatimonadota bacterium]MCL7963578.1 DUF4153 domain-containing protein [Candidatus Carthagonibacter metallireducens]MCL7966351.1 DUF4153 domain-containing protein [Gemmatimonadota bacterium]
MKLPSLERLTDEALFAARRFPLVIVCGLIAAVAGILLVDAGESEELYLRVLYAASLGLPLFVGLELVAERHGWRGGGRIAALAAGVALLLAIYLLRPGWSDDVALGRYFQLWLGFHLFVAVGPYLGADEQNGFWQYNMSLFLRFLVATLFAAVLFFGLSVALLAIDNLFGLEVDGEWYGRLWFTVAFVFHPWFFLGGVPVDLPALESRRLYPHALKVFAQYILAPIVSLYLVILTTYLGKVLLTQEWPSGWIGWLVSSVAVAGILSLLLLQPIEEQEENRWVRTYARWFWVALIPSIGMLLAAIWKRIDQYGITERRYYLVVLSFWLAGIALFYIARRRGSIKVIPATLALIAFVTLAGPWGAYAVSERSQVDRLQEILERNGMLVDGRISASPAEPTFEDRREISAVVRYLVRTHGVESIEPWFEPGLTHADTVRTDPGRVMEGDIETRTEAIVTRMGAGYVSRWAGATGENYNLHVADTSEPLRVSGNDWAISDWRAWDTRSDSLRIEGRSYELAWDAAAGRISLADDAGTLVSASLATAVEAARAFRSDSSAAHGIPARILTVEARGDRAWLTVYLRRVSGSGEGIESFTADLFFTLDPPPEFEPHSPDTTDAASSPALEGET